MKSGIWSSTLPFGNIFRLIAGFRDVVENRIHWAAYVQWSFRKTAHAEVKILTIFWIGEQFPGVASAVRPCRAFECRVVSPSSTAGPAGFCWPRARARLHAEKQTGRASDQIRFAVGTDGESVANRRVLVREDAVQSRTIVGRVGRF